MSYGESFISKVLDTGDVHAFDRYDIDERLLATEPERRAYTFIVTYAAENHGDVPDYRTVEAEIDGFTYIPTVADSFKFLADEIKEYAARYEINEFWSSPDIADLFKGAPSDEFITYALERLSDIAHRTSKDKRVGFDLKRDIDDFKAEYQRRKDGKSFTIWQSLFPSVNRVVGGYLSGNVYAWFGRSGRGKSVFVMMEAIEAARQGANVLIWSLEMPTFELAVRMLAAISAHAGITELDTPTGTLDAGFSTKEMLMGRMDDEMESTFFKFLKKLNDEIPGNIVIRAVNDPEFTRRDVRQLETDIKKTDAQVVVVDPIYYMQMEANTSKTAGGDVAKTSMALRHVAGRHNVVMHVITQAEETKDDSDEEGNRKLTVPKRVEVKKAKQILEDASNLFGIDTCDGRGMLVIGKGRNGGEDLQVEVQYMPQYGIVRETQQSGVFADGSQFDIF